MSIEIKQIDEKSIEVKLKENGDFETLKYIKALKHESDLWKNLANKATSELKRILKFTKI